MKWFDPKAITKEISKIRWPKKGDLASNSVQVIIFTGLFVIFFFVCQIIISWLLTTIGVM